VQNVHAQVVTIIVFDYTSMLINCAMELKIYRYELFSRLKLAPFLQLFRGNRYVIEASVHKEGCLFALAREVHVVCRIILVVHGIHVLLRRHRCRVMSRFECVRGSLRVPWIFVKRFTSLLDYVRD